MDPFETLALPARFSLTNGEIQQAYLSRAGAMHPDRARAEDGEEAAAVLNRAREMLMNPESRAEALLTKLGGASSSSDRSLPEGFLMEMMELREKIDEQIGAGGAAGESARERWEEWGEERRAGHEKRVGELFAAIETAAERGGGADAKSLKQIRAELNAWRYIERMIEQLDPEYRGP